MPTITDDDLSPLSSEFKSIADIKRFYSDPTNDMTCRSQMLEFANANPQLYKLMQYAPRFEEYQEESRGKRRDVFLYRYLFAALGGANKWRPQYQKRGTCVGQGGKLGGDAVIGINHVFGGGPFPGRIAVAPLYAGSRVDIGKQPGSWDGSTGFWLVQWMTRFGVVLLKDLDLAEDSRDEDERIAVRWTASREGVPPKIEDVARQLPIKDSYVVRTPDEAEVAIDAGCPIVRCSSLIASGRRGKYGVSRVSNQGGHCELVWAKFYVDGKRLWNEQNSWSEQWGSGERYPEDMPPGSVNLTDGDFAKILASGDCHALVGVKGLEPISDKDNQIFL